MCAARSDHEDGISLVCIGTDVASAGNRTRVTSMATMYSTTRPPMLGAMLFTGTTMQLVLGHTHTPGGFPRVHVPAEQVRTALADAFTLPPSQATPICIGRESNPGHIDGNDVFCH